MPFRHLRLPGRRARQESWTAPIDAAALTGVLDLFEELVYIGELTPAGEYIGRFASSSVDRFIGGPQPRDIEFGRLWSSLVHPEDRRKRDRLHAQLRAGAEAEVIYRVVGLDGVTRSIRDRARPVRQADGGLVIQGVVSDVTRRAEADARAAEAADRFFTLLDVVGEHVYVAAAQPDGTIRELFQGPGADRLLGGAEPDSEMENWEAAIHPEDRGAYDDFNARLIRGERSEVQYRLRGADGITRWVHDRAATRTRPDGALEISGIVSDVTDRRRLEDELRQTVAEMERAHAELERARQAAEQLAHTDELTGALSRRRFAVLAETVESDVRGLLLLDADHFKRINDRYGHAAGDQALVELAGRIRGELGDGDLLARWGGEEFVALLAGVADDAALRERAERVRAAVAATPVACGSARVALTVSIGAVCGARATGLDRLVAAADTPSTSPRRAAAIASASSRTPRSRPPPSSLPQRATSPRSSVSPARLRTRRACWTPTVLSTSRRWPTCARRSPPSFGLTTRACCAAGSAGSCTTSARSPFRARSSRAPRR